MDAGVLITQRRTGSITATYAVTARKWATAHPFASQNIWASGKEKATASATQNAPAKDSKGQADLLAKLMAQIKEQSAQIDTLKASF